jgi:N-ethylmaleimide reductase
MVPLTRGRSGTSSLATELMVEHYAQRASAGSLSQRAQKQATWVWAGGARPTSSARMVCTALGLFTDAVNARGSHILCQICHSGRAAIRFSAWARKPAPKRRWALHSPISQWAIALKM